MAQEYSEKDIYVLLDFQGKDTSKFLKHSGVFFRMLNLNEDKPIVEIGEDVYEGTYRDTVGTNVYFEEVENPIAKTNVFEGTTPITLQYLLKQSKILSMKKIGTKPKPLLNTNPTETVNINIKDDYKIILEKFQNNTLNIQEYISEEASANEDEIECPSNKSEEEEEENEEWQALQLPPRQNLVPEWYISAQESNPSGTITETQPEVKKAKQEEPSPSKEIKNTDPTYIKYIKLQKLSEQPSKHKIKPEIIDSNKFELPIHSFPKKDFYVWKNMVMQCVEKQQIKLDINKDKIEDFVNIENSIASGIILPSNENPRIFTKEEKQELLSFKNFINVSPLMKLIMLQDYVNIEKTAMAGMTAMELNTIVEDGCTVKERYILLKNFKEELRSHMILRLQDGLTNDENFTDLLDDNISLNLSDNEQSSDSDFNYSSDEDDANCSKLVSESEQQSELQLEYDESSNIEENKVTFNKSDMD